MFKSTLFIAVQCCQCSTMQVKQQKKRSNKWACAVCNEKQSVRKVYAQGYQAKDIRQFVQSFNMSRKFADEQAAIRNDEDPSLGHFVEQLGGNHEMKEKTVKRRVDWSEYVEDEEERGDPVYLKSVSKEADAFEPEIVTEFPDGGMFKKLKLKGKASSGLESNEVYKPQFSKRTFKPQVEVARKGFNNTRSRFSEAELVSDKHVVNDNERNVRRCWDRDQQQHMAMGKPGASKWREYIEVNEYVANDNEQRRNDRPGWEHGQQQQQHMATEKRGVSKWSEYMAEDEGNCFQGENSALADDMNLLGHYDDHEPQFADQRVDDDIHPDFL